MIDPMAKIRLVSPRTLAAHVTRTLQEVGVLHIESEPAEAAQSTFLRPHVTDEAASQRRADLDRLHEGLRRLLLLLPEIPSRGRVPREQARHQELTKENITSLADVIRPIASRVDDVSAKLKACEEELALLSKYERVLTALTPLLQFIQESEALDYLGVTLEERESDRPLLPLLREMMGQVTEGRYELFHARAEERVLVVLLVFPKAYGARIRSLLWEEDMTELQLPASVSQKPLGEAIRTLLQEKTKLPLQASRHRQELREIALQWRRAFARYDDAVVRDLEQIEASTLFYQTDMTTVIYGWLPRRRVSRLRLRMEREFGGRVVIEESPVSRAEWATIPVRLRNPWFLRPFETLTRLIGLPKYGSIDPTPYLGLFFPLFYGVILGDAGYGLLLLAVAALVRRRSHRHPLLRDLSTVLLSAAGMAILFGLLFGEVFGGLGERIGLHPVLDRMQAFLPLLAWSIGIGTVHVTLGIGLGALSAWQAGNRREGLAKCGGVMLVLSFISLMASTVGLLPRQWTPGEGVGFLCALAVIFLLGGGRGAMELHNLVNVLSYLRLMGIGVASAALAFAANKLGGMASHLVVGVAIAGTLHGINFAFGILSPTIQSLRLHYVEFFENFFAPGGRPYKPFAHLHPLPPPRG